MARFAAALALVMLGAAAAESACPDGVCPVEGEEASALLQSAAAARVSEHRANTTQALGCTTTPAATCGNPDKLCFLDTEGCSPSGAGVCCKAAGGPPAPPQCRFCGVGGGCPECPTTTTTTTTTTMGLGCTTTPAATCGNPDKLCFLDTEGCSPSGAGVCCMAAGGPPAPPQCRFCGVGGGCPECPPR